MQSFYCLQINNTLYQIIEAIVSVPPVPLRQLTHFDKNRFEIQIIEQQVVIHLDKCAMSVGGHN